LRGRTKCCGLRAEDGNKVMNFPRKTLWEEERKARRWVGLKEDLREERQAPVLKRAGNL